MSDGVGFGGPSLRILMIAPQPFFQTRGTPFSVYFRLRALSALGHRVDLVTYPIGRDVSIPGVRTFRARSIPFIKRVGIGPSFRKIFLDAGVRAEALRRIRSERYDLVHSHEEAALFGWKLAKRFGIPHLYDMHSLLSEQLSHYSFFRMSPFRTVLRRLERRALAESAVVITISSGLNELACRLVPDKQPVLIENMVDEADFSPIPRRLPFESNGCEDLRRRLGFPDKGLIALYAGSLEPYQGMNVLLDSAERVSRVRSDVTFIILGGEPRRVELLRREVARRQLQSNVLVAGVVAPERMPEHLEAADILLSPRAVGTNVPSKIYAYLKSGRPVVATAGNPHSQLLSERFAVLTSSDPAGFAEGILRLASSPSLRRELGMIAATESREKYSLERYLQVTAEAVRPFLRARAVRD